MSERTAVAVVGGGITGLALGYHLARNDVPHLLFEATGRPGGVVRSARVDGHLLEWGPQRTRLTAGVAELIEELDLGDRLITAPPGLPLFVYRTGKLRRVPFSAISFLGSDLVPLRARLRAMMEPLTGAARAEESVATYFTRKLGRSVYENLAGPLYGGLYASDPADMVVGLSLGAVLQEFGVGRSLVLSFLRRGGAIDPPVACSFRDGMSTLTDALHRAVGEAVRLESPVHAVRAVGGGWEVEWEGGRVLAEQVVVTAPAPVAARLLAGDLPAAAVLGELRYNPLAIVHLLADTPLRGLGYQVGLGERLATRGVTFNDSLFGRTGVYTAYLGGARDPELVRRSNADLASLAIAEFREVTGYAARALAVERERMPAWDRTWTALSRVTLPPGLHLAANWQSRPGIPGRLAQAKRFATAMAAGAPAIPPTAR
jgi:protoporphyrinogen/coproporphyrinogen III oxidase